MTTNAPLSMKARFALLKAPFPSKAIEWKIGHRNKENTRGRALPFLQFMAVADRLDDVLGEENWKASYVSGPAGGVVCKLELRIENEWICKENGAGNTEMEGIKGGLTDAFKRAATMWGVGRYLHAYDAIGVDINEKGQFQPPALPDFLLPAEEVEQNRIEAEAAAIEEKAAAAATAAAIEAAGQAGTAVAEPAKPAKPAKAVKATKAAESKAASKEADDAAVQTSVDVATDAGAPDTAQGAGESDDAIIQAEATVIDAEAPPVDTVAAIATEVIVDGPADTAAVDTLAAITLIAAEPAAEPAIAETSAVDEAAPAADEPALQIGEDGVPVMPANLADAEVKLINGLVERIVKGGDLRVIREYAVEGNGTKTLGAMAQAYMAAYLDHAQKQLDAQSEAASAEDSGTNVAETVVAEPAAAEAIADDAAPAANDAAIELDANGLPVMPENLNEAELKLIKGLVGRIAKGVELPVVRDYVVEGAGKNVLGPLAQAYVLAYVDHAQKNLAAPAKAA